MFVINSVSKIKFHMASLFLEFDLLLLNFIEIMFNE